MKISHKSGKYLWPRLYICKLRIFWKKKRSVSQWATRHIDMFHEFSKLIYFISFFCLELLPPSRGLLKPMDTNWRTDSHHLDHRRRCRLRRFVSDADVERGCLVSGPLTWILCGNQDLLLKYGTARERRKERQEQANGESDRTTRRGTEIRGTEKKTEKEKTRCSLSVTGQSFFKVLTVRFLAAPLAIDRNRDSACSRMISLRATRPGSLRPPHCGREFCPVCR